MASTSAIVNRALRSNVRPILIEAGFERLEARKGWRWRDKAICIFEVRAVGNYFSSVTGWPPGSVGVSLSVFFTFAPRDHAINEDERRRLLPAEHLGHLRSHLECATDQASKVSALRNPAERRRRDIFWVERDGSNADSVAAAIAHALRTHGVPWFEQMSRLDFALASIEVERDCFHKFDRAAALAREIGDRDRWLRYATLADAEARRIGRAVDRITRYGI